MKNKVLVAGCGISGIGAARMLLAAGKSVILYDGNDKKNKEEIRAQVADNSSDETLSIVLGTLSQDVIDQSEYCVISPGIPTDLAFVEELKKNGVPIWSEIELAYHYASSISLQIGTPFFFNSSTKAMSVGIPGLITQYSD